VHDFLHRPVRDRRRHRRRPGPRARARARARARVGAHPGASARARARIRRRACVPVDRDARAGVHHRLVGGRHARVPVRRDGARDHLLVVVSGLFLARVGVLVRRLVEPLHAIGDRQDRAPRTVCALDTIEEPVAARGERGEDRLRPEPEEQREEQAVEDDRAEDHPIDEREDPRRRRLLALSLAPRADALAPQIPRERQHGERERAAQDRQPEGPVRVRREARGAPHAEQRDREHDRERDQLHETAQNGPEPAAPRPSPRLVVAHSFVPGSVHASTREPRVLFLALFGVTRRAPPGWARSTRRVRPRCHPSTRGRRGDRERSSRGRRRRMRAHR
jgi:hypothetical protein